MRKAAVVSAAAAVVSAAAAVVSAAAAVVSAAAVEECSRRLPKQPADYYDNPAG